MTIEQKKTMIHNDKRLEVRGKILGWEWGDG
jgi:hypothetical protein